MAEAEIDEMWSFVSRKAHDGSGMPLIINWCRLSVCLGTHQDEVFVQLKALSRALRLRPGEGIAGQALATMAPVLVEDAAREPRFLRCEAALASGYVAVLCTPLIAQSKPVGTLQLYASAEHQYSAELLPLVQAISEQLAVAIANARLHESVRASEVEYRSLVENTPRLIFRLDLDGHCIFVNRTLQIMLGWPSQTVVSAARLRDFLGHPDDWPEAALTRALARGDRSRGGVPFAASRWQLAVVSAHGVSVAARR